MENYRRMAPGSNYGKINNRIWKLSNNQRFLYPSPPWIPLGKPFHASSWVAKQAADTQSVAVATHKRVYLAEERRQRLCRPISTVTPTAVWNCECNSLNTGMGGGGEKIAHLLPGCCRTARLHRVPQIIKWRRRLKGRERQPRREKDTVKTRFWSGNARFAFAFDKRGPKPGNKNSSTCVR